MEAFVHRRYGGPEVLELVELPGPEPAPEQVLVRVHAASINAADYRMMRADPFLVRLEKGPLRPRKGRLGADVAGVVSAAGRAVTELAVGDRVFGDAQLGATGSFAEQVCLPSAALARIPEGASFEEAAALPLAGVTALQAVRDRAGVHPGQRVLVQGAGGGVGTLLTQIAKGRGAHVTAICGPRSVELIRSLGADDVLDYTEGGLASVEERFDAIFGVNGHWPLSVYRDHLREGGVYVMVGGANRQIFEALLFGRLAFRSGRARVEVLTVDESKHATDLRELTELLSAGALRPVIDRVFPLSALPDAMRYVEEGHVAGKVVLRVPS